MTSDKIEPGTILYHPTNKVIGWVVEKVNDQFIMCEWADGVIGYCSGIHTLIYRQSYLDLENDKR